MENKVRTLCLSTLFEKINTLPCHIAFYGASVTQQGTGYVRAFKTALEQDQKKELITSSNVEDPYSLYVEKTGITISQLGYGSLHLKDSTLLLEESVLPLHRSNKIDICFLEWFTSEANIVPEDLQYLIQKLTKEDILPVFLLLYNHNDRKQRAITKTIYYNMSENFRVPLIDLDSYTSDNELYIPDLFRDNTHHTVEGGKKMGELLYSTIKNYTPVTGVKVLPKITFVPFDYKSLYKSTLKFVDGIAHPAVRFNVGNVIRIPNTIPGKFMGIWTIAGPDSGVINISNGEGGQNDMSIWDQWSHYDRFVIRRFGGTWYTGDNLEIKLTDREPNYSTCRRDIKEWPSRSLWVIGWSIISC